MNILFHEEYRRQISKFTRRIVGQKNTTSMNIATRFGPTSIFVRVNPMTHLVKFARTNILVGPKFDAAFMEFWSPTILRANLLICLRYSL
uniref:Uncharacterized protein n=1 Tax=Acrobeloides nanus TaxID=290746 RepID=A0A914E2A8_9BILA